MVINQRIFDGKIISTSMVRAIIEASLNLAKRNFFENGNMKEFEIFLGSMIFNNLKWLGLARLISWGKTISGFEISANNK